MSSSYYYRLYEDCCKKVTAYQNDISSVTVIRNNLLNNIGDEIQNINNQLMYLESDLNNSIRYNDTFKNNAKEAANKKENPVTSDTKLKEADSDLYDEIERLKGLKRQAETDRDYNYNKYLDEKAKEDAPKPSYNNYSSNWQSVIKNR